MRKIISILLALILILSLAAPVLADETVKLTIAIPDLVNVEDYNTNEMTLQIEEELGVDLEFIVYPSTDYETKLNLMINSGDTLPDIIFDNRSRFKSATIYAWAQEGALQPLTKYYQDPELSPNIHKTFETKLGDWRPMVMMPDGEIYQVPAYYQSVGNEQEAKLFIDMTILKKLNLAVPTTTDELADVLRAVVKNNPDMIGVAGYGGLNRSAWFDYFMNSFVYSDSEMDFMKVEDGTVSFSYTCEAWKEGIKYIKSLIDEGLIAKESLTQDRTQWINMINSCPIFGLCYIAPSDLMDERKNVFESIEPMTGPQGVKFARYRPTTPAGGMVVTADCQNPDEAFRFGDLLTRLDWTITNRWGQRGQDWDWFEDYVKTLDNYDDSKWSATIPGCERLIIVYDDATFWGSGNMQNRAWMNSGSAVRDYTVAGGRVINIDTVTPYTLHMAESYQQYPPFYPKEYISMLMYTAEENEVMAEILANLKTYISLTNSNWLLGNTDIDAEWDAFQAELQKIGIDRALEIAQAAYNRSFGK